MERRGAQWCSEFIWGGGSGFPQGCWRLVCETKHDASEAEGPSNKARRGRGEGGGALRIRCFPLNQSPNSSEVWLRCNRVNGLEISEAVTVTPRPRSDMTILRRISPRARALRTQDGHALRCASLMKEDALINWLCSVRRLAELGVSLLNRSIKRGPWSLKRPILLCLLTWSTAEWAWFMHADQLFSKSFT